MQKIIVFADELTIREAMDHPGAYFQSVCLSTIRDGFTNGFNTGNTLYHLSRSDVVRQAKLPCRIWHWVPVKGRYYMGLIMVDSPGGEEVVTIKCREQVIGKIRAGTGDGKRHLYLFEAPFDFEFAETLEILTPADDHPYCIEGFLFLPEMPVQQTLPLQEIAEALTVPAFAPWMLPREVGITNPGQARDTRGVTSFSLTLPGLTAGQVRAAVAGEEVPCDLVPLTAMEDGTPLTQQVQVLVPVEGEEISLTLALEDHPTPVLLTAVEEAGSVRLTADGRDMTITTDGEGLTITGLSVQPVRVRPCMHTPTSDGPVHATEGGVLRLARAGLFTAEIEATFTLRSADAELGITLTLQADATLADLRLTHSFVVRGPERFVTLRALSLEILSAAVGPCTCTTPASRIAGDSLRVAATDRQRVTITTRDSATVVPSLESAGNGAITVAPAEFDALYPATLEVTPSGVQYHLIPAAFSLPDLSQDERDRRFFWVCAEGYRLKRGMMRRHALLLCPPEATSRVCLFQQPLLAQVRRTYAQGCLWHVPEARSHLSEALVYRDLAARILEGWLRQQEGLHAFGLWNYGDWFGERAENWGNSEYDTPYGLLMQYLATNDPAYLQLGSAAARHLLEVDTIHAGDEEWHGWQYPHCMGHVGEYFPRGYKVGAYPDRVHPNEAHTWVEGPLLYYLLTGDRLARDTMTVLLDDLAERRLVAKYYSNGRDVGWHLIHLVAGAGVFRSAKYLQGAQQLVRLTLERQRRDGSWRRVLNSDHCTCYPHHTGNTGFMLGILMEGLCKYHDVTGEPLVEEALVRGIHFIIADMLDRDAMAFHYTSCPHSRLVEKGICASVLGDWGYMLALGHGNDDDRMLYRQCREKFAAEITALLEGAITPTRMRNAFAKDLSAILRELVMLYGLEQRAVVS